MNFKLALCLCLLLILVSSCTVGPDYRQPDVNSGSGWTMESVVQGDVDLSQWWKRFEDPVLNQLVERAVLQNLDIKQALARIEEVRALYNLAAAEDYPSVQGSAAVNRRRQSENGPLPVNRIAGLDRDQTIYDLGFDAIWEIDIFGGNRRALEAAKARLQEAVESLRDIQLSIVAEVVRRYVELRSFQQEFNVRQQNLAASRQIYTLVTYQFAAGEVAEAQVALADTRIKQQQAQLPPIESEIRTAALALSLLVGNLPESELDLLNQSEKPLMLRAVPVGTRADVLRRRPDIRVAERRLAAATADIGTTTAELFPKLTLSAAGGFESLSSGSLLQSSSQTWNITPIISWRIFEGGRIRAQIQVQQEIVRRLALGYEKAVLTALSEAEQSLARYRYSLNSVERQQEAVAAADLSYQYTKNRYEAGDISLFELLDAQQRVYDAETAYTQLHRGGAVNLVSLYKTLGGGWENAAF